MHCFRNFVLAASALALLSGCAQESSQPEPIAPRVAVAADDTYSCDASSGIPADLASLSQTSADDFAWQTFLALNVSEAAPVWNEWSSTVDLIDCNQKDANDNCVCPNGDCTQSGSRYYPNTCQQIDNYEDYRVLDQVGKVDDSFLEAQTGGLSGDPVIAANGTFLRYEILLSPATYDWVVAKSLQQEATLTGLTASDPVSFPCGVFPIVLKLAWMEMTNLPDGLDASSYYTEDVLVHTPKYRNSTGNASCELKTMGLVGTHINRKTESQPTWVFATFEHAQNAPDCTSLPPAGSGAGSGPSTACPASASENWNFNLASCADGDSACQSCNVAPADNAPSGSSSTTCLNEEDSTQGQWCLDQPPASTAGYSQLCRQIPYDTYYAGSSGWDETPPNAACQPGGAPWSSYQLISTQWYPSTGTCTNQSATIYDGTNVIASIDIQPQVLSAASGTLDGGRSYLANTSMESYERSNCMGCHSQATVDEQATVSTDFSYYLALEVPAASD